MENLIKANPPGQDLIPGIAGYVVKVLDTEMLTHNVKRFILEKPEGFTFTPGQATDVSINLPGLQDEFRPFTFTSLNSNKHLEFIIKIYKGHNGITEKLENIIAGDELIVHEVFGNLIFKGQGVFIAGGAGITPFLAIFRQLQLQNQLSGNTLLFANRSVKDIILKDELNQMLGESYTDVLEISDDLPAPRRFIDRNLLAQYIKHENQYYYICGPDKFVSIITDHLSALGIGRSQIIIEE